MENMERMTFCLCEGPRMESAAAAAGRPRGEQEGKTVSCPIESKRSGEAVPCTDI